MIRGHIRGGVLCDYCATLVPHSAWKLNSFAHPNKQVANNCLETRAWQPFLFQNFCCELVNVHTSFVFFLAVVSASVHFTALKHETGDTKTPNSFVQNKGT